MATTETSDAARRLHVEDLTCRRGGRSLFDHFNLAIEPGEAVQLTGGNGRGKTTLLRTLSGLQRPGAGRVLWRGLDAHEEGEGYDGELLYLAHENALNPDLTPRENLIALARVHGVRKDPGAALIDLGLQAHADRLVRRLSAGQRRRAALARLNLSTAPLWLLDEPAAALDSDGRALVGRLIADHVGAGGLVVFTTHEPLDLPGLEARTIPL